MKYIIILLMSFVICNAQDKPWISVDNQYTNVTTVTFEKNWEIISVQRHSTGWIDSNWVPHTRGVGGPAGTVIKYIMIHQQMHDSHCYTVTFKRPKLWSYEYYTTTIWCSSENIKWSRK